MQIRFTVVQSGRVYTKETVIRERGRYVQIDKGVYHHSVGHDAKIRFQVSCCSGHISSSRIPYTYTYLIA